jgi:asparagine synthase (glutamine-hydrolysing)
MCGIAGYFGPKTISDERVKACLARMEHRGPDAEGVYRRSAPSGRNVCLLHSRLSIIDLDESANQPMAEDGRVLVLNGELYNYLELRAEFERAGRQFRTQSDTEVLLATLSDRDTAGLQRCEGMWAFAYYTEGDGTLVLSRDRFGEKPLYLLHHNRGLYFGSEIKFILALLGEPLRVNSSQIRRYLVNGYKSLYKTRETFFEGLEELPAGTALRVDMHGVEKTVRYWLPRFEQQEDMTWNDAVSGTRDALLESVRLRLRADVPIAFCLSGGIDSNALAAIAKRCFGYEAHGFTIVNTDSRYEEREMVECSVRELGLRHTEVALDSRDFLSRLRELVRHHDAPVYTISYYVHWLLMEEVHRAGYRIAVSGTGADELFSGYYDHHNLYLAMMRQDPSRRARALEDWRTHIQPIVRNPHLQNPDVFLDNPGFRDHIYLDAERFSGYLTKPWREEFAETAYTADLLRNRMANELFHESVPVILHEDDHNAMYYSIENRSPFLDSRLFEFCNRIPTRHLIKDGKAKAVLREAMRQIVPDAVLDNRRKVGFNAPLLELLDARDSAVQAIVLEDSPIFDYVRRDAIRPLLAKASLSNSESKFLFYFLCSKFFLEQDTLAA